MHWTKEGVKFYLLGAVSMMPETVNEAMKFYSEKFDEIENELDAEKIKTLELQKNLDYAIMMLKNFGLDKETLIETPKAIKFLSSLSSLPISYTENEKAFIEKLNVAVSVLRNNSAIWCNLENLPHEIWCDLVGYEGFYQVSNYGRLKSLHRKTEKIIGSNKDSDGYPRCSLCKNGTHKSLKVHQFVSLCFIPNPQNKPLINHKNGDKENNCVWNLEWVTNRENVLHSLELGLQKPLSGENCSHSVLTNKEVKRIREMYIPYDEEFGGTALAKIFNVNVSVIRNIVQNRTYKDA